MQIGNLTFNLLSASLDLVAEPIRHEVLEGKLSEGVYVSAIDPELADTALFCETYNISRKIATNCIIIEAKRAENTWYAACLVLADDMIDVNGKVRKHLEARKISFAPKDTALALTHMEYGGITPLGLPKEWPILIDERVLLNEQAVIGGGLRGSKIAIRTSVLSSLDHAEIMNIIR